ncbi:MAG: helix-turn-helix transcriptional regulator [Lachnospiraceae bacterium]|nr:helix-turn-helix transcriptional regulator [Lachnospiraceae bacterium]
MIFDFHPFYPPRPYPVSPVPSRVVELTIRKQSIKLKFFGPHLFFVLAGIAHLRDPAPADHPAGTVLFSATSASYTISSGSAAVSSLCIYEFEDVPTFSAFAPHLPPCSTSPAASLSNLTETVNDALKNDPVSGDITAASLLYSFLLTLTTRTSCREPAVRNAAAFIARHFAEPLGAADIEQAVDIGGGENLSRSFTDAFDIRPVEYLKRYRLHRAAILLADTNDSLEDIARACGFSGRSYLSALFTKHYGKSPAEYRRKHRLS